MAKDLNTYLAELVETELSAFDGEYYWNKRERRFEIFATIYAQNQEHTPLSDVDEVVSSEDYVEFNDGIAFYDEKMKIDANEFLAVFPFSGRKGLSVAVITATVAYFKDLLIAGQDHLAAFLADDDQDAFELTFDKEEYKKYLVQYQAETELIPYPRF